MPKISVVSITYNAGSFIKSCLDSLCEQTYKDFETILVDNASIDKTVSLIKKFSPEVTLLQNNKNYGVCKARNQAIKIAKGKYILTLDSDVVLDKDFLLKIKNLAERVDNKVGMIGAKIMQFRDKNLIDSTEIILTKARRFLDRGYGEIDRSQYDKDINIFGPCAAAALYKKEMLEDIKKEDEYFDSRFFYLVEDFDLSWRARNKGWSAVYCPEAKCFHRKNGSNTNEKIRQFLTFRNRYFLLIKNQSLKDFLIHLPFMLPYDLLRFGYLLLTNKLTYKAIREVMDFGFKKIPFVNFD